MLCQAKETTAEIAEDGSVRPRAPKYSVVSSAVQTPQNSTRFRRLGILSFCAAAFIKFSSLRIQLQTRPLISIALFVAALAGCDHGLAPPEAPETGVLRAYVEYVQDPDEWPSQDSLADLRFVAMRFVPRDTTDFLQLNRIVFSDPMPHPVREDVVVIPDVAVGAFLYSGVAQKFGPGNFDWRPVGLVTENGGFFTVSADETTDVHVLADFDHPPEFPPPTP